MKYIIPENRLQNIIFKYLDDKLNGIEIKKGKYLDIVLALHGEKYGLMGWEKPDKLYVNWEFVDEIKLMFSMRESESLDVIGRYAESRYNLKVNHTVVGSRYLNELAESRYNLKVNHTNEIIGSISYQLIVDS